MASVDQKPGSPAAASTSASQRADESDLDPAAFLKSVRELSEKREREDAERYRALEQEIERGRQERAARRSERAKSISPVKADYTPSRASNSPMSARAIKTPPPMTPPATSSSAMDSTASQPKTEDVPEFKGFGSGSKTTPRTSAAQSPAQTQDSAPSSTVPSRSASSLARSGTLSWQQRPSSRGIGSRPVSMISTSSSTNFGGTPADSSEPSRDQIAASLGSRDPSWFRQTADRGHGNAAFRKNKDEATPGESFAQGRRGLPGMSKEVSVEPVAAPSPPPSADVASEAGSQPGVTRGSVVSSGGMFSNTRTSTSSKPDLKALIAEDSMQEKASPMSERTTSNTDGEQAGLQRTLSMSSSQARLAGAADRPASPTKGMGGFVQSAMMKRSDSVNKRWSAQPSSGISRQNSTASMRSGYGGLIGSHSMPKLEPTPGSRQSSKEPSSRPTSSSSNLTNLTMTQDQNDQDVFVKPALPSLSKSRSVAEDDHTSPPSSPSKRWSPTKSTWLESAITKPESPKPAASARNSQPSWMADIAKAKAQRASADSTPKPVENEIGRPVSPTKTPFGQGMLKRSDSRGLDTPRSGTPKIGETASSRSTSPTKTPFDQSSRDIGSSSTDPSRAAAREDSDVRKSIAISMKPTIKEPEVRDTKLDSSSIPNGKTTDTAESAATVTKPVSTPSQSRAPEPMSTTKPRPETPPKPQTDFRSSLRTRAPSEAKQQAAPEFLSKFGNLKKTSTQNYVAPDVLKGNILRGKSELAKTGGPVKTQRRDELKESLLAKKDQWKKEKDEGIVHERKVSGPPQTPQKPEALAKRELLGRAESVKTAASPEKPRDATPEALARHKSLKDKSEPEVALPVLKKQRSEPTETSKMAARFNPGLAGILARGPPATGSTSNPPSRSDSPVNAETFRPPMMSPPGEPIGEAEQLQDMRKGRAKGPKRRKGGARDAEAGSSAPTEPESEQAKNAINPDFAIERPGESIISDEPTEAAPKPKPRALPGSAASLMMASLKKAPTGESKPSIPAKSPSISSPKQPEYTPAKTIERFAASTASTPIQSKSIDTHTSQKSDIPEFNGFGSVKKAIPALVQLEDNKENAGEGSPSVKSAASMWGRPTPSKRVEPPTQIQLPSKKDEAAAMRSAGLLASSPSRPGSSSGLAPQNDGANGNTTTPATISNVPPKPNKPSKAITVQRQAASPNRGLPSSQEQSLNDTERHLAEIFGSVPRSTAPLSIDTHAVIATTPHQERVFRTVRKSVQVARPDGSLKQLSPDEEYTFFEEDVYICTHAYTVAESPKKTEIFVWVGESSTATAADQAHSHAKRIAKENGNAYVHTVRQGIEAPGFLQALGGILVTRRGSRDRASKQHMLRGRKHLGQIVFDEVDFDVENLCSGFAYLISFPVTLQETMTYLWKGSACSTEEISGGKLAAMGSTEGVDVIEVDDGVEFASFLKIFGPGTTKASIPKATQLWQRKALAPHKFTTRLFRMQQAEEVRTGLFSNIFTRRPSWGSKSQAGRQEAECKVEAIQISPFAQMDLEADCIYVLDAYTELHVLIGPMFPSQHEAVRNTLLAQTLLFASEYAVLATSEEDRPAVPRASVLFSGVPPDLKMIFRHWDESTGLWGTGGLMAGSSAHSRGEDVDCIDLPEVLDVVCRE